MILLLSHSKDPSIEHISSRLKDLQLFRFDIDSWSDYRWDIGPDEFTLMDRDGKTCSHQDICAVYLKGIQPDQVRMLDEVSPDGEIRQQVLEIWLGLRDWAHETGKLALVRPSFRGSWTRIRQLHIAKDLFPIPDWRIRHGVSNGDLWLGTAESKPLGHSSVMNFFQQDLSHATHNVVVIWVEGKCYSYELKRHPHHSAQTNGNCHGIWAKSLIFDDEKTRIMEMMHLTGLDYARLDFIRADGGQLYFLGLNPNGHFGNHDSVDGGDILDAIASSIRRVWELNRNREKWLIG
jgi:hypothetical protein